MASLLASSEKGYLPYFLVYVRTAAPHKALVPFRGPASPPSKLLAHVYGTKNVYTAAIRLFAVVHITNAAVYDLSILSFAGVLWLYGTEVFVYRTVRLQEATWAFVTAGVGLTWMLAQREWYLE